MTSIGKLYTIKQTRIAIGYIHPKKGFINWLIECGYLNSKCEVNPTYERAKILLIKPHVGARCGKIFFSEWGLKDLKKRYNDQINELKTKLS